MYQELRRSRGRTFVKVDEVKETNEYDGTRQTLHLFVYHHELGSCTSSTSLKNKLFIRTTHNVHK